jgi:Tfp pilus assembly protein PilX
MSQENRTKMLAFSLAVLVIITTLTVVLMNDDDTEEVMRPRSGR